MIRSFTRLRVRNNWPTGHSPSGRRSRRRASAGASAPSEVTPKGRSETAHNAQLADPTEAAEKCRSSSQMPSASIHNGTTYRTTLQDRLSLIPGASARPRSGGSEGNMCWSKVGKENAGALPRCRALPTFVVWRAFALVGRPFLDGRKVSKEIAATALAADSNPRGAWPTGGRIVGEGSGEHRGAPGR